VPSKGWAEMKIITFIEDHKVIDKIIRHLKISFMAERPPPPHVVQQELLMAAEEREKTPEFIIWLFHVMMGYL